MEREASIKSVTLGISCEDRIVKFKGNDVAARLLGS